MILLSREAFETLVDEAIDSLPDEVQTWLDNVAIVVADRPSPEQQARTGLEPGSLLFGLYEGVPKTKRGVTYGETRYSGPPTGTPTNYRFTGQQQSAALGLYHMGARWYDPYINRFVSPDTIIPDPANPQSFNRYSYVNNRPLVATDPTGHDLVIVGGAGGDVSPDAMMKYWMEWILAYKGWNLSSEEWKTLYSEWAAALTQGGLAAGNTVLAQQGIHIFTWGENTVSGATEQAGSAPNEKMLEQLSNEMAGHRDITLLGWSKGGNLVMRYLQKLSEGANLTKLEHAVFVAPADSNRSAWANLFLHKGLAVLGDYQVPSIGVNAANLCAEEGDVWCNVAVPGAINFNHGLSGHGPHGRIARQVFAALSVANDWNAWSEPNGWR